MRKYLILTVLILILVVGGAGYLINWAFFDIQRLEGQVPLIELTSPDETYTVTAYLNDGGATTGYAILGSVKHNETGKTKNIYWNYRRETVNMNWIDDETIQINGVTLNVKKDHYDYRRD